MRKNYLSGLLIMAAFGLSSATPLYAFSDSGVPSEVTSQQKKTISGIVTDTKGEPLIGATVIIDGTTTGSITAAKGEYSFSASKGDVIVCTYLGYKTATVTVGDSNTINIAMEVDAIVTDEVVVVGYGSMEKKEVTSSITSIKSTDLMPSASSSPLMAMQGKVTGLSVVSSQGTDPNASISLQLRGVNSVNASAGPLVVVDGVPGGNINNIPREDIVSIDILKDASAAAIYGTRASGGVILVTTRQAKDGPVTVQYTSEFSTETIRKKAEVLSPEEYVSFGQGADMGASTDWFDLVTQQPFNHRHNLSLSGGTEKFNAYTSLNYRANEGVAIGTDRKEMSGRFNFNYKALEDILEFRGNVNYSQASYNNTNVGVFNQALKNDPTTDAFDAEDPSGYNVWTGGYDLYNPLADVMLRDNQGTLTQLQASLTTKLNITDKLNTSVMVATRNSDTDSYYYRSPYHRDSKISGIKGYASQSTGISEDVTLDWLVNYNNTWGDHKFGVMGGYSFQEFNGNGFNANNSNFPVAGVEGNDLSSGTYLKEGKAGMDSYKNPRTRLVAFFGRANYSYDNRYMITASARYEGSSKFATGNRWGLFPSVSAGWRISQEEFMKDASWVDDLRLRVGWGRTGNEGFSAGKTVRMYGADSYWYGNGAWFNTYGLSGNVNKDLVWETKDELNFGVDFTLLNNRLSGKFDWYKRTSDNLIYDISVSVPPAVHNKTTMNVGTMTNKGFEIELTGVVVDKATFNYTTTVRASHNTNTLESLWGSQTYFDTKYFPSPGDPGSAVRIFPGQRIGQFYMWKYAGVDDNGDFLLYDKDDNVIPAVDKTTDDKRFMGNAIPKVVLSWENTITYKRFDVSAFFRSMLGYDVFNMPNMYYGLSNVKGQNVLRAAYEENAHITGNKELCDYWLESGNFLKLDALTIGYNVNTEKFKDYISNARVYVTGRDLFCLTGYSGFDPEINVNGLAPGFEELSVYPKTRTFLLGVQITF